MVSIPLETSEIFVFVQVQPGHVLHPPRTNIPQGTPNSDVDIASETIDFSDNQDSILGKALGHGLL